MTEPHTPPAPEWVYKRDGRFVPFDADKISRALFAAGEQLGRPDAFLARELTDGVVHFLKTEFEGAIPTTAQVAELAGKVVRELGQPALAQAFATGRKTKAPSAAPLPGFTPTELAAMPHSLALVQQAGRAGVAAYALRDVFSSDLAAAQREGWLTLEGLESPLELAGWLLGPPARPRLIETLEEARRIAGSFVAIDGPEYSLAEQSRPGAVEDCVRELGAGLRTMGLRAVVNLNSPVPPHWAGNLAQGPLFGSASSPEPAGRLAEELCERLLYADLNGQVRLDWHLAEQDFADRGRLVQLARRALDGAAIAFAFDRPRRSVPLAEGMDRRHPAVLLVAHLHLPRLLQTLRQSGDAEQFLRKLGSLARMALSAGVQKRAFLRRMGRSWPAFLLDRARLVVMPTGLEEVVSRLSGQGFHTEAGLQLARSIVQQLDKVLLGDGRACQLDACLEAGTLTVGPAPLKQQAKAAATLLTGSPRGLVLQLAPQGSPTGEELAEVLYWTWKHTDLARLRFVRGRPAAEQLVAPWERPEAAT